MKLTAQNNTAFTDMSKLNMKPTAQSNNRELMWHQATSNKELMKRVKEEINNQHNVQEGDSNSDTLGTNANRPVDTDALRKTELDSATPNDGRRFNPQDYSGTETSSVKEDNGNCTFPADSSYNEQWDSYYNEKKDIWLEEPCQYKDCEFCSNRPTKPSDCVDSK